MEFSSLPSKCLRVDHPFAHRLIDAITVVIQPAGVREVEAELVGDADGCVRVGPVGRIQEATNEVMRRVETGVAERFLDDSQARLSL